MFKKICAIFPEKRDDLCRFLIEDRDYFDGTILRLDSLELLLEICPDQRELLFCVTIEDSVRFHNLVKKSII